MKKFLFALCFLFPSLQVGAQTGGQKTRAKHITPPPAAQAFVKQNAQPKVLNADFKLTLSGVDNKKVSVSWNNPEPVNGVFDDFEAHPDFVINSPGTANWQYIDADNQETYTWTSADFPNQGQRMAFIVFNPSKTSPSTADWPDIKPFSGQKMLIDFTVDGGNNDYLISPELNFDEDFQVSFRARSYTESYGKERFRVGYSTTGTRPSDFRFVQKGDYEEAPAAWTLYAYTIPKEARYVCINCVSHEAFMFMLDDLFVGTNQIRPKAQPMAEGKVKLAGFNLLRDGVKVNKVLLTETNFTDEVPDYGSYVYTIEAVMTDGTVGKTTEPLSVVVPDIRLLPFEDNFDSGVIDPARWTTPVDDKGNDNLWRNDYYPYGLVDWSACYPYSRIGNDYAQNLVTTELRTQQPDNTYLRCEVRLDNDPKHTGNFLAIEISADAGRTWHTLEDIPNEQGSFNWRTYEFALSDALKGANFFYVRFRAHGNNPFYINYWYVDDVKVWCPSTAVADILTTSGGEVLPHTRVSLVANHGARYEGVTDAAGKLHFDRLEYGTYEVQAEAAGCNMLQTTWDFTATASNTLNLTLLRPVVSWSEMNLTAELAAEQIDTRTLKLTNNGDGELQWNLEPTLQVGSGDVSKRFEVGQTFDASGDLQSSVAFDGEFFYTTSNYQLGKFYKYSREGRFIEEFSVPGMYFKLYDLAYDGTYFYGSDLTNTVFELDLRNKRLIREFKVKNKPKLTITHMAYDPRNDEFWVGDWTHIGRIDREGNVKVDFFSIDDQSANIGVIGSAFDNVTPGGPYLWLSNLNSSGYNKIDKVQLLQYDLNNRRLTAVEHTATDVPGYKTGVLEMPNNLGGIELTTQLVSGQLTMVGILQQSPARIFTYRMADFDNWYSIQPMAGTLKAGEETEVKVQFDMRKAKKNDRLTTTLAFHSIPELRQEQTLKLHANVVSDAEAPRPTALKAVAMEAENGVKLTWQAATGSNPTAYKVFRDSVETATVAEPSFTDKQLLRGTYCYAVQAVYGEKVSALTDTVSASVKVGAPYFAPTALQAKVEANNLVKLQWKQPDSQLHTDARLRWDDGVNADAVGLSDGGYFYAGVAFDANDLEAYRGMRFDRVDVFVKQRCQSLSLKIYKDGKSVLSQRVATEALNYGEFNTIELKEPLSIERGCHYIVAFLVAHEPGVLPLGISKGKTVEGKSNLMSEDGKNWYPASYVGFAESNFNVAVHLTPDESYQEERPSGFSVVRNGQNIGTTTDLNFTDRLTEAGTYTYQVISHYAGAHASLPSTSVEAKIINLGTPIAPAQVTAYLRRNSQVELHWSLPLADTPEIPVDLTTAAGVSPQGKPEFVSQFRGARTGEMGIASDGKYIYTTRHTAPGIINRYTLQGVFDESFKVTDQTDNGFLNLAYDGQHFYATAKNSNLYEIDMEQKRVVQTMSVSEIGRHLAYIPELDGGRGGFETGDWETSIYVSKKGAKLADGPVLKGAAGSACHNGVLYTFEQGYERPYELCARNLATGEMLWHAPITDWTAIKPLAGASAGGMSVLTTDEGLQLLCVALQESGGTRFVFLDLGSVKGLAGYNVFRNGQKVNTELLATRRFAETLNEPGDYTYQIQTQYVDGTVSPLSSLAKVTVIPSVQGEAPTNVKARMTSEGYNVNVSVVDPTTLGADVYQSFENAMPDELQIKGFAVTATDAYHGDKALQAAVETQCELIIPVNKEYEAAFNLSFAARNLNDAEGYGTIQVLTSSATAVEADFIALATIRTNENWQRFSLAIPATTHYVALRCPVAYAAQLIDAVSIHSSELGQIYGYDVMRNDRQLNNEPFEGISFTDHNLLPGTYTYKVRAYYDNASVSEWSEPVEVAVNYSNGNQAPGPLTVTPETEGNRLCWSAPALSGMKELRWHNGVSAGAAGLPNGGAYFAGVQWDAADLQAYASLSISEVGFFVNQIPDVLFVQLYEGGELVFEKYVSNLKQNAMNVVKLDKPLRINAEKSLRAVVYVEHNSITVPLGYDDGPAKTGRGDLYSPDGQTWSTLSDNDIDGNWNITLGLRAYAADSQNEPEMVSTFAQTERYRSTPKVASVNKNQAKYVPRAVPFDTPNAASSYFAGYNVYCNGQLLNAQPLGVDCLDYIDKETHTGRYWEYQVKAIYPGNVEVGGNLVRVVNTGIADSLADEADEDSPVYDLRGVRVDKNYHGPVVKKGKKFIR